MQILGIILGFAILIYVTYKNWSVYLASFLASVAVIVFAGLPLTQTIATSYIGGIGAIFTSIFGMFLFGSVMAKIYAVSGAASSIATTLCNAFLKNNGSEQNWIWQDPSRKIHFKVFFLHSRTEPILIFMQ